MSRLISYFLVIGFGLTTIFFVPHFAPNDPVEGMLAKISSTGLFHGCRTRMDALRASLTDEFGLKVLYWRNTVTPFDGFC